jgi:hypothetical protein
MDIPAIDGNGGHAEVTVLVGGDDVSVSFDPGHLAAHADDFVLTWQEVIDGIAASLEHSTPRVGVVHAGFPSQRVVGVTGVVEVGTGSAAFWGYRPGRTIPSHLIVATKVETREMCVWGEWLSPQRFDLWTCYPGGPAPREIHDPALDLDDIDASIAFWSVHAIVIAGTVADAARSPTV